jgi:AcrR family transcriptional regulator
MNFEINFQLSPKLYLKNPEESELGKNIVAKGIEMIYELGYEKFTFKKLAQEIPSTEATIYRYFENKHKFLNYVVDIYWSALAFYIEVSLKNINAPKEKLKIIIDLLVWEDNNETLISNYDLKKLFYIVVEEGSKTYLSKDVEMLNKDMIYKPYKDLNALIANVIKENNPTYTYAESLASMLIESSHSQYFFMQHLPRLSSFSKEKNPKLLESFLLEMVLKVLI